MSSAKPMSSIMSGHQRDDAHSLEREVAALVEVLQPAGGADDQIDALPQRARLRPHRCAAVHAQQRSLRRDALDNQRDLLGELARRRHHRARRARRALRGAQLVQPLDCRQAEGQRLAHAGARAADDVLALLDQLVIAAWIWWKSASTPRARSAPTVSSDRSNVERERRIAARVVGQRRHSRRLLVLLLVFVLSVVRLRVVGSRLDDLDDLGLLGLRRLGRWRLGVAHALLRRRLDWSHGVLEWVILLGPHFLREPRAAASSRRCPSALAFISLITAAIARFFAFMEVDMLSEIMRKQKSVVPWGSRLVLAVRLTGDSVFGMHACTGNGGYCGQLYG